MGVWAVTLPVETNVPDPFPATLAVRCCCHDLLSTKLCTVTLCTGGFYAACLGLFQPLRLLQIVYSRNSPFLDMIISRGYLNVEQTCSLLHTAFVVSVGH